MGNWDVKLLERVFSHFVKKVMDKKSFAKLLEMLLKSLLRASPTVMQLDFAFLKFVKNFKNCSPTVLHLTYAFCQTRHLMNQTWHFCIGTMGWQF